MTGVTLIDGGLQALPAAPLEGVDPAQSGRGSLLPAQGNITESHQSQIAGGYAQPAMLEPIQPPSVPGPVVNDGLFSVAQFPHLAVVLDKSPVNSAFGQATVVVECDLRCGKRGFAEAIERLDSPDARNLALHFAATQGIAQPGVNGRQTAFPVNAQGEELAHMQDPPARYRAVFQIQQGRL